MARDKSPETDEARLQEKVRARKAATDSPGGDAGLRKLRKRLKRLQRKRRHLAVRAKNAMGKSAGSESRKEAKAEAPPGA